MKLNYISNSTMKTLAKTGPYDEVMATPSACPCASSLTTKCKFLAQAVVLSLRCAHYKNFKVCLLILLTLCMKRKRRI